LHPIATNVGVNDGLHTVVFKFLGQIGDLMTSELAPAVGGYFAILRIQAHDDAATKGGASVAQKPRVSHRCCANDDVTQAQIKVALDGV